MATTEEEGGLGLGDSEGLDSGEYIGQVACSSSPLSAAKSS